MITTGNCHAQTSVKDKMKQRAEIMEQNRRLQEMKVSEGSMEQAKEMKADGWKVMPGRLPLEQQIEPDGWKVMPGRLPLEQQIERSALFQNQFEEDFITPAYVWGEATTEAETYDAGLFQALEFARLNLAGNIESKVTQLVDNKLGNNQKVAGIAQSISTSMGKAKSLVSQKLGQTSPVVSAYRMLSTGAYQVRVMTFYSMAEARRLAIEAVKAQSEKDGQQLANILFGE